MKKAEVEYAIQQGTQIAQEMEKAVLKDARRCIKEEITVMTILKRTDKKSYGNLMNAYLIGRNELLTTISDLLKLLNSYKPNWKPRSTSTVSNITTGHSFFQLNMPAGGSPKIKFLAGTNGKVWSGHLLRCMWTPRTQQEVLSYHYKQRRNAH